MALDLELTPALLRAGLAREAIRFIQEARKKAGLDVSDRITLQWDADGQLAVAVEEHASLIADEVLAVDMRHVDDMDYATDVDDGLGLSLSIAKN